MQVGAAGEFDAVVVGSGPNGLVGAVTLAEGGLRVLLLEAAAHIGGGLRTEELTLPGFRHDVCASVLPLALASPALRDYAANPADGPAGSARAAAKDVWRAATASAGNGPGGTAPGGTAPGGTGGRAIRWAHPPVPLAHPLPDGPAALLWPGVAETADGLAGPGGPADPAGADPGSWARLVGPLVEHGTALAESVLSPFDLPPRHPVALARFGARGLWPATVLARTALRGEPARALLAGLATHSMIDLHRPVTAGYGLFLGTLAHTVGWPVAVGGSATLATALAARLTDLGGEIRAEHPVRSPADLPPARIVLLDLTPRQVLSIYGDRLPADYRSALGRYRYGPAAFKVDWALDGPVPWRDPAVGSAATVHLGGTVSEIAAAERAVARGHHPSRPFVLFVQATVADRSRAPAGKHTGYAYCHVPLGSTVDMTAAIEAQVERFAPGFRDRILARHVLGPAALEARNANAVGGDIGGGTADLRQLLARPVASTRPWATPLGGVYVCSAATPPGGGAHGMGGRHAARLALASLTRL